MPPTTSADDTLVAAHLASGILAATMRVASVENLAAQAPLAAKLFRLPRRPSGRTQEALPGLALLIARNVVMRNVLPATYVNDCARFGQPHPPAERFAAEGALTTVGEIYFRRHFWRTPRYGSGPTSGDI
jgi:hypothetical protein